MTSSNLISTASSIDFGLPFSLLEKKEGYRYGYQGSESDSEVKGEGNSYTTMFRQLDPRIGRWLTIDPKIGTTPWESPYMSMGDNPIWRNDVLGDKWKTRKDKEKAKDLDNKIQNRIEELDNSINTAQQEADDYRSAGKNRKALKAEARINNLKLMQNDMIDAKQELKYLGEVEREFTFKANENDISYTYMGKDKVTVIEYGSDANAIHELKHAMQSLVGDIEFIPGDAKLAYDVDAFDEIEAYRRQFNFNPSSVKNLNTADLNGAKIHVFTTNDINIKFLKSIYTINGNNSIEKPYIDSPEKVLKGRVIYDFNTNTDYRNTCTSCQ